MPPVALVVGASRGIGRQIAIDLARSGYAVVVAAKSVSDPPHPASSSPDPTSPESTISTVVREITAAGGTATAVPVDVRDDDSVQALISATLQAYSRLDAVIYAAGAIWWSPVATTPLRRYRLMQRVNADGLYAVVQAALPHMTPGGGGRFVVVSPPIYSRFVRGKTAYAMGKMAMSVLTMGLAVDFEREGSGMAITSLWPAVAIESAATQRLAADRRHLRKPSVFSDAVLAVLAAPRGVVNGRLLLDEDFLRDHAGVSDFSRYSVVPGAEPRRIMPAKMPDLTVAEQDDEGARYDSAKAKL